MSDLQRTGPDGRTWRLPLKETKGPCSVCKGYGGVVSVMHWSPCFTCMGSGQAIQALKEKAGE